MVQVCVTRVQAIEAALLIDGSPLNKMALERHKVEANAMKVQAEALKAALGGTAVSLISAGDPLTDLTKAQTDFVTKWTAAQMEMTTALTKADIAGATAAQLKMVQSCAERLQDIEKAVLLDESPPYKMAVERHKLEAAAMKAQADALKAALGVTVAGAASQWADVAPGTVPEDLLKAHETFLTDFAAAQKALTEAMMKMDWKEAPQQQLKMV